MADQLNLLDGGGNESIILFPSAARTISQKSADQTNNTLRGVQLFIDVSAIVAAPSIEVTVEAQDPATLQYYELGRTAAITAVGQTVLRVEPGSTEVANEIFTAYLALTWRIQVLHANANSITYSIGANITGGG